MRSKPGIPRLLLVSALGLVSFLVLACATTRETLPVEELVGCWYFAAGEAVNDADAAGGAGGAGGAAGDARGDAAGNAADSAAGARARDLRLPLGVRLTDQPLEGWPAVQQLEGVRAATTLTPEGDRDYPFGFWRPFADGDSVHVGYPGGGGLAMDLDALPDQEVEGEAGPTLGGAVRPVGDVLRTDASTDREPQPVRLTRGRCPQV